MVTTPILCTPCACLPWNLRKKLRVPVGWFCDGLPLGASLDIIRTSATEEP